MLIQAAKQRVQEVIFYSFLAIQVAIFGFMSMAFLAITHPKNSTPGHIALHVWRTVDVPAGTHRLSTCCNSWGTYACSL